MKKAVAFLLLFVFFLECAPMNALADVEGYLLEKSEIERLQGLYGWDDEAPSYHLGMTLPEQASAKLVYGWVDSLYTNRLTDLMETLRAADRTLDEMRQKGEKMPEEDWLRRYDAFAAKLMNLENDISYYRDTLFSDMSTISANADLIWDEGFAPLSRRYASYQVQQAAERSENAVEILLDEYSNWEGMIYSIERSVRGESNDEGAFFAGLQALLHKENENAVPAVLKASYQPMPSSSVSALNRLQAGASPLGGDHEADVMIMNENDFTLGAFTDDEAKAPISGAELTVIDCRSGNVFHGTTDSSGFALFNALDFSLSSGRDLLLDVTVAAPGYRKRRNRNVELSKGQNFRFSMQKDDGTPYIYSIAFNGRDVLSQEETYYYSIATQDLVDLEVCAESKNGCTVTVHYYPYEKSFQQDISASAVAGDATVHFNEKWCSMLGPGKDVTFTVQDQSGASNTFKALLTMEKAVLEEPFQDTTGATSIPWGQYGGGGLNITLPDSIVKPIGGSRLDVDLPFGKYVPRFYFSHQGAGYVALGINVTSVLTEKSGIATMSKKQIDAAVKKVEEQGWFAREMVKAKALWNGGHPKTMNLSSLGFDVNLFALLQGKYEKLSETETNRKGAISLSGCAGAMAAIKGEIAAQFGILYGAISLSASIAAEAGIVVDLYTDTPKGQPMRVERWDFRPAGTGITVITRFEVGAAVGFGIRGFLSVSVNGYAFIKVTLGITYDPMVQVAVGGGIYVLVEALFIKWRIDIWETGDKVLYDSRRNEAQMLVQHYADQTAAGEAVVIEPETVQSHLTASQVEKVGEQIVMSSSHVELASIDNMMYAFFTEINDAGKPRLQWINLTKNIRGSFDQMPIGLGSANEYDFCISPVTAGYVPHTRSTNAARYIAIAILGSSRLEIQETQMEEGSERKAVPSGKLGITMFMVRATENGGLTCMTLPTEKDPEGVNSAHRQTIENLGEGEYPTKPVLYASEDIMHQGGYYLQLVCSVSGAGDAAGKCLTMITGTDENKSYWAERDQIDFMEYKLLDYASLILEAAKSKKVFNRIVAGGQTADTFYKFNRNAAWYEQVIAPEAELPDENASLIYYRTNQAGLKPCAYLLDQNRVISLQVSHTPFLKSDVQEHTYDGYQTDRVFYLTEKDNAYHLMGARVVNHWDNYYAETELRRIDATDYGVTLTTPGLNVVTIRGATLLYWLESCAPAKEGEAPVYRVSGTFYDENKDIMTSKITLAEIDAKGQCPINLQVTNDGMVYYALCDADKVKTGDLSGVYTADFYRFPCSTVIDLDLQDMRPVDTIANAGDYLDTIITLKNNGNTPIAGLEIEVLLNGQELVETVHIDFLNPNQSRIIVPGQLQEFISDEKAVYPITGMEDALNSNNWHVQRRIIMGEGNPIDFWNRTRLLMPQDLVTYRAPLKIPASWRGGKHLVFRLSKIDACMDWSGTVKEESQIVLNTEEVPLLSCIRQSDGSAALLYSNAAEPETWPLRMEETRVYFDEAELDHSAINYLLNGTVTEQNGQKLLLLSVTGLAEDCGEKENVILYAYINGDEGTRWQVMNLSVLAGAQGLYAGRTVNLALPLTDLLGGASPKTLTLEVRCGEKAEVSMEDNRFTLNLKGKELNIQLQPKDQWVLPGDTAVYTVQVQDGIAPYHYQWQVQKPGQSSFIDLPGQTEATLRLEKIESKQSGSRYRCLVSDEDGSSVLTQEANLTVLSIPKTGDASRPVEWAVLMLLAAGIILTLYRRKTAGNKGEKNT